MHTLSIPVPFDAVNEGLETFLVRITNVLTACPFVIGNGYATVDREGKLIAHYTNTHTAITSFVIHTLLQGWSLLVL